MTDPPSDDDLRRRRRAWIAAHHPDRGGDPAEFAAGLARFDAPAARAAGAPAAGGPTAPDTRPTVYRSRSPLRRLRRLVRSATRPNDRRLL